MKENQAQLKIADLGFCHILSENETQVKLNLGTIGTKAPEIILNKPYDASIDMFSTGVIFYQLLCDGIEHMITQRKQIRIQIQQIQMKESLKKRGCIFL